jgi:hypothetical protein
MNKWIKIALVVLLIVTAPWWLMAIYMGGATVYGRVDKIRYAPTAEFTSSRWQKPDRKYRYAVLDTVATRIITNGMQGTAVVELLGKPDLVDTNSNWQYETKRPGWHFIDFSGGGLLVEFDSNRLVQKATVNTWID